MESIWLNNYGYITVNIYTDVKNCKKLGSCIRRCVEMIQHCLSDQKLEGYDSTFTQGEQLCNVVEIHKLVVDFGLTQVKNKQQACLDLNIEEELPKEEPPKEISNRRLSPKMEYKSSKEHRKQKKRSSLYKQYGVKKIKSMKRVPLQSETRSERLSWLRDAWEEAISTGRIKIQKDSFLSCKKLTTIINSLVRRGSGKYIHWNYMKGYSVRLVVLTISSFI